MYELVTNVM